MQEELKTILNRYKAGTASEEDTAFLESWYLEYGETHEDKYLPADQVVDARTIWAELQLDQAEAKRIRLWPRIAAAASIILCLSISGYLLLHKHEVPRFVAANHDNVIAPAGHRAILKLSGGRSILLSNVSNGVLSQKNAVINKVADSELVYHDANEKHVTPALVYDTLITPRGGHFQLVLADGTKVWMNAATVIRYPETFAGVERRVELIRGEAYFEVVHNRVMPFKVTVRNQVIRDIGTHFNVKAYDDERAIETTLLEGSVSVSNNEKHVILRPGQLSIVQNAASPIVVKQANPGKTLAWKNDHFVFDNESIQDIMQEVSRWYDVDVSYEGDMSGKQLTGSMSRSANITELLRKLEETGAVHFRVTGRKVTVTP